MSCKNRLLESKMKANYRKIIMKWSKFILLKNDDYTNFIRNCFKKYMYILINAI